MKNRPASVLPYLSIFYVLCFLVCMLFCYSVLYGAEPPVWTTRLETAESQAKQEGKFIFAYFSGSDWCMPCIQLKKMVLEKDEFRAFAAEKLVLLELDFPQQGKNRLSAEQIAYNESMAERYNTHGAFPLVVILKPSGEKIGEISGYKREKPEEYLEKLRTLLVKGE